MPTVYIHTKHINIYYYILYYINMYMYIYIYHTYCHISLYVISHHNINTETTAATGCHEARAPIVFPIAKLHCAYDAAAAQVVRHHVAFQQRQGFVDIWQHHWVRSCGTAPAWPPRHQETVTSRASISCSPQQLCVFLGKWGVSRVSQMDGL